MASSWRTMRFTGHKDDGTLKRINTSVTTSDEDATWILLKRIFETHVCSYELFRILINKVMHSRIPQHEYTCVLFFGIFAIFRVWRTLRHTQWQDQSKCPRVCFKQQKQVKGFLMCTAWCNDLTCPSELIETGSVSALQGTIVTSHTSAPCPPTARVLPTKWAFVLCFYICNIQIYVTYVFNLYRK
jgi:hypothetical protein